MTEAWLKGAAAETERQHQRPEPAAPDSPRDSEDALALAFANQHANALCYVAEWNRWLQWDGTRWRRDRTELAFDHSREICRNAAAMANPRDRKRLASAATVAAVARLARADRLIAATAEEWDMDPDLLNTPGGVVHLPSGEIWPHEPGFKMTKITAVEPGGDCPRFLAFLDQITDGNQPLVDHPAGALIFPNRNARAALPRRMPGSFGSADSLLGPRWVVSISARQVATHPCSNSNNYRPYHMVGSGRKWFFNSRRRHYLPDHRRQGG